MENSSILEPNSIPPEIPQNSKTKPIVIGIFALLSGLTFLLLFIIVTKKPAAQKPIRKTLGVSTQKLSKNPPTFVPTPSPPPTSNFPDHLVISEIYNSPDTVHKINNSKIESEWIEIYNPTNSPILLENWSIKDNQECDNLPGSPLLEPLGFLIITKATKTDFDNAWDFPNTTNFLTLPGSLGNGLTAGESISIRSNSCTDTFIQEVDKVEIKKMEMGHSMARQEQDYITKMIPTPGF